MNRTITLISASPKIGEESVSKSLIEMVGQRPGMNLTEIINIDLRQSLSKHQTLQDFENLFRSDAIVVAFPLYIFCLPGLLTRFLEDYYHFYTHTGKLRRDQKIYAIVNCGFPEASINEEAVRVIQSFSEHIGAEFRFGIMIGAGGMFLEAQNAPFMKKTITRLGNALDLMVGDAFNGSHNKIENFLIAPGFPRRLYFFMGDWGFKRAARKNNLNGKDLRRKPYRPNE